MRIAKLEHLPPLPITKTKQQKPTKAPEFCFIDTCYLTHAAWKHIMDMNIDKEKTNVSILVDMIVHVENKIIYR